MNLAAEIAKKLYRKYQVKISGFICYLKPYFKTPLENLPDAPDIIKYYRDFHKNPALTRKPGGWEYKGKIYPDYLHVGGACNTIFKKALEHCKGEGIDIGAGFWPLPGSVPTDMFRGPGLEKSVDDFEDGSLDYVFSSHCLEHIENWKETLDKWVDKVKKGGIIFLYLPHPECEIWHPGAPFVGDKHKWIPKPQIIKDYFKELGLRIMDFDDGPDAMQSFFVCAKKGE